MSAGEYCNREVIVVDKAESVREAIRLMRSNHVGDVVVVEQQGNLTVPLGILTDRDIVIEILAEEVALDTVTIGDVMSYELVTVGEDTMLMDAIKLMRSKGVRRLPVVDQQGGLVGLLTVDDVLDLIVEQMSDLVALVSNQISKEQKLRE
ncbi:MAG: CBS domain-containing protein [Granulosicoccaceae bacterium]|jgi:CBS domain-containing protein